MTLDGWLQAQVAKLPHPLGATLERELGKRWVVVVLGLAAVLSTIPIASVIGWGLTLLVALGVVALVVLAASGWSKYCTALVVVLGAIALPWLTLIAFNFLLGWLLRPLELGLWPSLVVAALVFAAATVAYLRVWKEHVVAAVVVAVLLTLANVVGLPMLIASSKQESSVAASTAYVSKLDLAIVVPAGAPAPPASAGSGAANPRDWDVRWSVARAGGDAAAWLLLDSSDPDAALAAASGAGAPLPGAPAWREDADRVVLLDVDGLPPVVEDPAALPSLDGRPGEVARWLGVAERLAPGAQVAVLLQSTDRARIAAWSKRLDRVGGAVASIQQLGTRSLTDAAQLLAVQAPGASAELALATRYRPILLFDEDEQRPSPYDVDDFFASGRISLCHDDRFDGARCEEVRGASGLTSGPTHLKIRRARRGDRPIASAIYVHPVARTVGGRRLLFLDYWWYLDDNPARVGHGATCGVGLAMPGITCFDHPSDWEGMTVVLDVSGETAVPIAVQYAQHKAIVRYDWRELQARWAQLLADPGSPLSGAVRRNLRALDDASDRPVAFVGLGTHATYARPCPGSSCRQTLDRTTENSYDGERSWGFNDTARCVEAACVRLLPTRRGGREPALWNAYAGVWGDRTCILKGAYCTAEQSPSSPSAQGRYRDPARITGWVDAGQRPHRCGGDHGACPALPATETP
ncbi:MAG TPA: hypothetical protein VFS37_09440 [Conexibacter sp.]|nr:hypothetical protein [Conexibacter sp.]